MRNIEAQGGKKERKGTKQRKSNHWQIDRYPIENLSEKYNDWSQLLAIIFVRFHSSFPFFSSFSLLEIYSNGTDRSRQLTIIRCWTYDGFEKKSNQFVKYSPGRSQFLYQWSELIVFSLLFSSICSLLPWSRTRDVSCRYDIHFYLNLRSTSLR